MSRHTRTRSLHRGDFELEILLLLPVLRPNTLLIYSTGCKSKIPFLTTQDCRSAHDKNFQEINIIESRVVTFHL